jgi:hypothetical protein
MGAKEGPQGESLLAAASRRVSFAGENIDGFWAKIWQGRESLLEHEKDSIHSA